MKQKNPLLEIFQYFLKLGCIGFGGPLSLIAMMQRELVEQRNWISKQEFNNVLPLIKSMPGPIAFQMSVYLGRIRSGFWGGSLAGLLVITPAFLLILSFAWLETNSLRMSSFQYFFQGLQYTALALILGSLQSLMSGAKKDLTFFVLLLVSAALTLFYPTLEPLVIVGAGALVVLLNKLPKKNLKLSFVLPFLDENLWNLLLINLKAGAFVFGTGLAIIPLLQHDFVYTHNWVTNEQFLNALALGQATPGPVVITVTYLGYRVSGLWGAVLSTVAIFLPSFIHMQTWFPYVVKKVSKYNWILLFTRGALSAVIGSILASVAKMISIDQLNWLNIFILIIGYLLAVSKKCPFWLIILLGGGAYHVVSIMSQM